MTKKILFTILIFMMLLAACSPSSQPFMIVPETESPAEEPAEEISERNYPTRPAYAPGELVEYVAQTGDTLPGLAARFNTTVEEIRTANPIIPPDATTMPPGMPMSIPIYYRALWGDPFQIVPDAVFVNGPDASTLNTAQFISQHPGWLQWYDAWAFNGTRTAAEIIDYVAINYSVSPKILLALLDYQSGAFSRPEISADEEYNVLGLESAYWTGVYLQLSYAANILNDGYYRWRDGTLIEFELSDGTLVRPDPWLNAATVSLQYFFSLTRTADEYHATVGEEGFVQTYLRLFGDPWTVEPHIAGSLQQPLMQLPYAPEDSWMFTGGPHTGWGNLEPFAALDFAPPLKETGCFPSSEPTTAVADGLVVRDGEGVLVLDLDGDGDERTGWVVFYLHIAARDRVPVGTSVSMGDFLGYPSCEGGHSTGTHIHISRKYNGEWVLATGVLPFVLSGWKPLRGDAAYSGYLVKDDMSVLANTHPDNRSAIPAAKMGE
ncbi:LysM peptidoglycan-binding domain-containing protein [bacterium]|nr:LysM peptidoglycan-binding domain-containing protein [bacterium]